MNSEKNQPEQFQIESFNLNKINLNNFKKRLDFMELKFESFLKLESFF